MSCELNFPSDEMETWFSQHTLQGWKNYYPPEHDAVMVQSIGGRIFIISPLEDFAVKEITPLAVTTISGAAVSPATGSTITVTVSSADKMEINLPATIGDGTYNIDSILNNSVTLTNVTATPGVAIAAGAILSFLDRNSTDRPLVWMEQAEEWLVIQDGLNAPILHNGSTTRRANKIANEVPTGTVMVYNEEIGRLCVCVQGNEIAIGDIVGGPTSVISFTETDYLAEGGRFRIPRKFGNVTGAIMMTNLDRSNGQGAMLFFAERGISAFNLPPTRSLWKSLNYPPQVNMPIRYGAMAQDSIVTANGDVFYRAKDGIRSFIMAIREFGKWGNVPLSREMDRVLKLDDQRLLKFSSAVLFDNRLLMTCSPRPLNGTAFHGGFVVLDFDLISSMGESSRPVYDGLWTGIQPLKILTGEFDGEERCFIFSKTEGGGVELWEQLKKGNFDGDDGRIQMVIESRSMDSTKPDALKKAEAFELWIDRVAGPTDIELKFRPDEHPCWTLWKQRSVCQTIKDCDAEICGIPANYRPSYRTRLGFGSPPESCESSDRKPMTLGYTTQVKLTITGRCRVKMALFRSSIQPETLVASCD